MYHGVGSLTVVHAVTCHESTRATLKQSTWRETTERCTPCDCHTLWPSYVMLYSFCRARQRYLGEGGSTCYDKQMTSVEKTVAVNVDDALYFQTSVSLGLATPVSMMSCFFSNESYYNLSLMATCIAPILHKTFNYLFHGVLDVMGMVIFAGLYHVKMRTPEAGRFSSSMAYTQKNVLV